MKKLLMALVVAVISIGFVSCEKESNAETDNIYGIDRDKVETPGNKGN